MYEFLHNIDIFKALNISYMIIIMKVIKIQRCWKKYRYGKRLNITKILLDRQIKSNVSVKKYVQKRIPGIDPSYSFGDVEVRIIEETFT